MLTPHAEFHWADYLVFALSLGLSVLIGVIFAVKDKWLKQSAESYLMADRKMNWVLVGLSFWATVVDATFFIGLTTEFYYFGMTMIWVILARFIGALFPIFIVIPKFYRLGFKITSAYEYFERRFNLAVRLLVSIIYSIMTLLGLAVALYAPSLVLSTVTGLSVYWCLFIGASVCFIYTSFGGMRAVIWVDSLQVVIMVVGMCILAALGVQQAGGMAEVWRRYGELGQRANWNDIDPSPWNRHTVWGCLFLFSFTFAGMFSTNQSVLQRYMTIPKMHHAQWAVFLGVSLGIGFTAIVLFIAMAAFANLGGNEPMLTVEGMRPDEILGYFLMAILSKLHGVPGVVMASLFAASLSSLSSGQSALAAIVTKDFVQAIHRRRGRKPLSEKTLGIVSRVAGIVVGIVVMCLALAVPTMKGTLLTITLTLVSLLTGPLLGLMVAGLFCSWVESWGALSGLVASFAWGLTLLFGNLFASNRSLGLGMEQSPWFNNNFTVVQEFPEPDVTPLLFDVSYTWYVPLNMAVFFIVSTVVSLIVLCTRHRGRVPWDKIRPSPDVRYTMDDFRAATGCFNQRKRQSYDLDILTSEASSHRAETTERDSCNLAPLSMVDSGNDTKAYTQDVHFDSTYDNKAYDGGFHDVSLTEDSGCADGDSTGHSKDGGHSNGMA